LGELGDISICLSTFVTPSILLTTLSALDPRAGRDASPRTTTVAVEADPKMDVVKDAVLRQGDRLPANFRRDS